MSASPNQSSVVERLAEWKRLEDAFHDAMPDQGDQGDGGAAGRAMCQFLYDNAESFRDTILSLQEQLARAREALADIQLHACNHGGWVENDSWAGTCHIHEIATAGLARSTLSPNHSRRAET